MPRPSLLIALCVALSLACWAMFERGSRYEAEANNLREGVRRLERSNAELTASLVRQSEAVRDLEKKSHAADLAGRRAAEMVMAALPELHEQDKKVGSTPEEANQWLDSLFSR